MPAPAGVLVQSSLIAALRLVKKLPLASASGGVAGGFFYIT